MGASTTVGAGADGEVEAEKVALEEWHTFAPVGTRNAHTRVFIAHLPRSVMQRTTAAPQCGGAAIAELRTFSSEAFRKLLEAGALVR